MLLIWSRPPSIPHRVDGLRNDRVTNDFARICRNHHLLRPLPIAIRLPGQSEV